jgi:hypothetical protein
MITVKINEKLFKNKKEKKDKIKNKLIIKETNIIYKKCNLNNIIFN